MFSVLFPDWLHNVRKQPNVKVKIGRRTENATARHVTDPIERNSAAELYVSEVFAYDYLNYLSVHWGWPTRRKIIDALSRWLEDGVMVTFDFEGE